MKKFISFVCGMMCAVLLMCVLPTPADALGNRSWFDTTYTFTEAIVFRGDGEERVTITKWLDFENSDMIQITKQNGETYLTHSSNVILIAGGL